MPRNKNIVAAQFHGMEAEPSLNVFLNSRMPIEQEYPLPECCSVSGNGTSFTCARKQEPGQNITVQGGKSKDNALVIINRS